MDGTVIQWASGVALVVAAAAIIALARVLIGKANKTDVDKEFAEQRAENKNAADERLRQYRELKTVIERLERELNVLDKHSLTSADLTEMKSDIKEALKLIDNMPDRVASLEATRNKQSEK